MIPTIKKTGLCMLLKKTEVKLILLLLTLGTLVASCSSADDGNNPSQNENAWSLNSHNFERDDSLQTLTNYISGEPFTIVNVDSKYTNDQVFRFCNFVATFNTHTAGSYAVKSENTLFDNRTQKIMHISCSIDNGFGDGAIYESTDSNITALVTEADGTFSVTITEPVTLTLKLNDGMSQAPPSLTFKCNKVK